MDVSICVPSASEVWLPEVDGSIICCVVDTDTTLQALRPG